MKEKFAKFMNKNGIYVVLCLCVALVGVAVLAAVLPAEPEPEAQSEQVSQQGDQRLETLMTPGLAVPSPAPEPSPALEPTPAPSPMPDFTKAPQKTPAPRREKAVAPVAGPVQWGYAADSLIYSKTLDQWTTHTGVDVACKKESEVHSLWGGTVREVYEDDLYGVTVVVEHEDGFTTLYANLMPDPPVKADQRVDARDVVGYVGDSARCECADPSHLHFEMFKKGESVDPGEYVTFES